MKLSIFGSITLVVVVTVLVLSVSGKRRTSSHPRVFVRGRGEGLSRRRDDR